MNAYTPRIYQKNCLDALQSARDQGKNKALVVMASGLGKTLTGAFDIQEYLQAIPDGRVLVLCHSAAILAQTKETFKVIFGDGYSYGMYNGLEKSAHRTDFLFANLQSIHLHSDEFQPDEFCYVIVDEAHHSPAETYRKAIRHFTPQFLLGMTATPERMDDANLSEIFGETVYEYRLESAIKDGWLSDVEYRVKTDEIENLETYLDSGEKFSLAQLNREVFAPKRDEEIVRIIREEISGKDTPTMVIFCQTIAHAEKFAELMSDAVVIHSKLDSSVIAERLEGFRSGSIKTVCTVDMLNEGIDVPRTDVIVFLRVTQSKIVFTQQLGRGLRRTEGKDRVLVLDFVSTADRLEMLFQFEREFKSSVGRYPNRKPTEEREYFTLNIDAPVFRDRKVDIIALIERARQYGKCVIASDEEMLHMLADLGTKLGHTPTMKDIANEPSIPSHETYRQHFGSVDRALELAGFTVKRIHHKKFDSREEMLQAIKQKAQELGKTPGRRDLAADPAMPSIQQIKLEFGSLNEAIIAAGLSLNKYVVDLSDEAMLKLMHDKGITLGRAPTMAEVDDDPNMPNASSYEKRFGSYNNAVIKAGLKPNDRHFGINCKNQIRDKLSDEELLQLLVDFTNRLGHTPTIAEVNGDPNMPSADVYRRRFGGYSEALIRAGLEPNKPVERPSDEELLSLLVDFANRLGHTPTMAEVDSDPNMPSAAMYVRRFNGYTNAIIKAGLELNKYVVKKRSKKASE